MKRPPKDRTDALATGGIPHKKEQYEVLKKMSARKEGQKSFLVCGKTFTSVGKDRQDEKGQTGGKSDPEKKNLPSQRE